MSDSSALISIEEVLLKYSDMVYKIALSQTRNKFDTEDIFQEVFLRFLKNKKEFQSDEHIKAWLIRVTINCCKKHFISLRKRQVLDLEENIPYIEPEELGIIYSVFSLPKKYRTVLHLFYYEDLSIKQISELLHIKETTIKSQLSRARDMLRKKVERDGDGQC